MTYISSNHTAFINGKTGIYDGKIQNESVKYGRNAYNNYLSYVDSFNKVESDFYAPDYLIKHTQPPIDFEYRYLPETTDTKIDRMALMGAAFEELGKKVSVPVQELTNLLKKGAEVSLPGVELSADALDVNKDGQIDVSEYASSILVADMLSTNPDRLDIQDVNGVITNKGMNIASAYANVKNSKIASETYAAIYSALNLQQAGQEFYNNSNNTLDLSI